MTRTPSRPGRSRPPKPALRVGLFGLLGSGNLGNDGSLEAVLRFLERDHPQAVVTCMCSGPSAVTDRHGVPAVALNWNRTEYHTATGPATILRKVVGKVVDVARTLAWTSRQDVVVVPGMGVLEASLPLRPWGFPYSLLTLCAAGRLLGRRVALVSVGAEVIRNPVTRRMITLSARMVHYRSYRDALSRNAMRTMAVDVEHDRVYPDLAFALPSTDHGPAVSGTVGVGVMAYFGGNDDRERAAEIHAAYLDAMTAFVRWLVDSGRTVRLLIGDEADEAVVREVLDDLRQHRPQLDPSRVVFEPAATIHDLMRQLATVETVVATRYHNVLCALKLSIPTLSVGYAAKNAALMENMGLAAFCQTARSVDLARLVRQFTELESRRDEVGRSMSERNRAQAALLEEQFTALSSGLLLTA